MSAPLVSVLMPVYNAAPFLKEAIDSVLSQSFSDFELLLINDGSVDNSEEIILSIPDKRISYHKNEKNQGLVFTLNRGIDLAKGKYLIRMDSDDLSVPGRFQLLVNAMESNAHLGVVSSYLELFGNSTGIWKTPLENNEIKAGLIISSTLAHAPCIIRTDVLRNNKIYYRSEFPHMEDWDLWFRLMKVTNFKVIPKVLYLYRIDENNVTLLNSATLNERCKSFYRYMFTSLGWAVTEHEVELQAGLGKSSYLEMNKKNLTDIRHLLHKLRQYNDRDGVFPKKEFIQVLNAKIESLFYLAADKGLATNYWYTFKKFRIAHMRYVFSRLFKKKKK